MKQGRFGGDTSWDSSMATGGEGVMTCGTSSSWLTGSVASCGEIGAVLESALDTPDVDG